MIGSVIDLRCGQNGAMELVGLERSGHVAVITLQRQAKRNAVNAELSAAIDAALNELDDDPDLWCGVLTGGPDVFCAGTDLAAGSGAPTPRGGEYGIIRRTRTTPLIAAVEGVAFGGGFEIAMVCDLVVAAETARFGLPEVRRGVIATSGALFRTVQRLPVNIAKELLLTGAELSAVEAARLGFVNRVVPTGAALSAALDLAEQIVANAPVSVSQTLRAVDAILMADDAAGWDVTAAAQEVVTNSDDVREGIAAFFERRAPVWRNR